MTNKKYDEYELRLCWEQEQRINKQPLSERKEAENDLLDCLKCPKWASDQVAWMVEGSFGWGWYLRAQRVLQGSKRINKVAALTQMMGIQAFNCPRSHAAKAWKRLSKEEQLALFEAVNNYLDDYLQTQQEN